MLASSVRLQTPALVRTSYLVLFWGASREPLGERERERERGGEENELVNAP